MRFRSLLLTMSLLIIFSGYTHANEPRKFGIGFRYGDYSDISNFHDGEGNWLYIGDGGEQFIAHSQSGANDGVFSGKNLRFPLFLQLDENIFLNNYFSSNFISIDRYLIDNSYPEGPNYEELIDSNEFGSEIQISSKQTNISSFYSKFPQYQNKIDISSEPSLSADYEYTHITFGKAIGLFLPISERHRLTSLGIGAGIGYVEGYYDVNLCDPFIIIKVNKDDEAVRKCKNKSNLFSKHVSNFGLSAYIQIILYSYIGQTFELNFFRADAFNTTIPRWIINQPPPLTPRFTSISMNIFDVVIPL